MARKKIKDYPVPHQDDVVSILDKRENSIKLQVFTPEDYSDTWMFVKSEQKRLAFKLAVKRQQKRNVKVEQLVSRREAEHLRRRARAASLPHSKNQRQSAVNAADTAEE